MPFPPLSLHQRISSPGRDLFGKKKSTGVPAHTELTSKSGGEKAGPSREEQKPYSEVKWRSGDPGKSSWLSVPKPQDSEGVRRSSSMDSARHLHGKDEGKKEIQFTLSLTPEAILVIQKRNIEKQMMAKQQKCCASADFRHRRVFPSKKAHGSSNKGSAPVAKAESVEQDITAIVKISLLNDQYKYDDVEYEDEDGDVDETVVRKCKEWLKGVENAAALGERHLEAYRNMHRLRKAPCRRYAALLSDKVSSQSALLQQREEAARGKSESEAQQVERLCHRHRAPKQGRPALCLCLSVCLLFSSSLKQKKLSFSKLLHDDSYLKPLPKTSYYLNKQGLHGGLFSVDPPGGESCLLTILEHESGSGEGFAELIFGGSHEGAKLSKCFPRLLDRETDSLSWQEERGNQDLTLPSVDSKQGKASQTNQAPLCSPKQQSSVRKDRPSCSPPLRRVTSARNPCLETLVWDTATCCRKNT
ncbi:hypothetical protein KUCAC02_024092 [Chaenocephalus aceratus]|uniref:Uncharacterized protein n=1 Tax=Chaenocephalus aceratus TaxID=36190 RepID=A0ACB9WGS6_CHAAC|nr:hypothetical protein KUCAC02_024092 [Chaenocephalus aceratus]